MAASPAPALQPALIAVHDLPATLPEMGPCLFCGTPVQQVPLDYAYPPEQPVVRHDGPVPGYRCPACEAEYLSPAVSVLLEEAALARLESLHEEALAIPLRQSLALRRPSVPA